jgi:hypothetical protein
MAFSYLRIEADDVVFLRWPRRKRRIPRSEVDRFDSLKTRSEDGFSVSELFGVIGRSHYSGLLMKDGRSFRVPTNTEPAAAALRLNNELKSR